MKLKIISPFILMGALAGLSACGESTQSQAGPEFGLTADFTEQELIQHLVDKVLRPTHQSVDDNIQLMQTHLAPYCETITETRSDDAAFANVKSAYQTLMFSWQNLEAMQMQPLLANDAELRNQIYSWPDSVSACGVELDLAFFTQGMVNGQPYELANRANSRRGLDALETLLFNEKIGSICAIDNTVLTQWRQLSQAEQDTTRCEFAQVVLDDLKNSFQTFKERWYQGDNNYRQTLVEGDPREAINQLGQALFYAEFLKDNKLGVPLGYFSNQCGNAPCPAEVESPNAKLAIKNMQANLQGLELFFTGGDDTEEHKAPGFDDYLQAVGDKQTASTMLLALSNASESLTKIEQDMAEVLNQQGSAFTELQSVHNAIKTLTDQLKTHFITSLSVDLPDTSAGDND
ncbi:imelysin family protein [Gayadomonas joobiniege]|uniref:imelysin family protein n=1 Tax=Gayadomonas joobiniege TaxID=1234606 RepID=UPI000373315D|nr:imelysin family protein [Gayadomonas joobiniege]